MPLFQVYYCGKDCQKKHWKLHKPECKMMPYKVYSTYNVIYIFTLSTVVKNIFCAQDTVLRPSPEFVKNDSYFCRFIPII